MQAKKEKYNEKTPEKMIVNALFSGPVQLLICAAFLLFGMCMRYKLRLWAAISTY